MFVVGSELCLFRIEVLHFRRGYRFIDNKEGAWQSP
jgi:hypothetical protein